MNDINPLTSPTVLVYPDGRMDTKNTAAYTGLSPKTMAMMRCEGTGPEFIKRGRVFYFKDDVDAWLAEARYTSTAEAANHAHSVVQLRG